MNIFILNSFFINNLKCLWSYSLRTMQVSDEFCDRKEVCEETDCLTDGNVLYVGTRNLYQTYLPLGCQKLCVQIIGRTGAATSFSRGFENFNWFPRCRKGLMITSHFLIVIWSAHSKSLIMNFRLKLGKSSFLFFCKI